jgi:hypothetical protein
MSFSLTNRPSAHTAAVEYDILKRVCDRPLIQGQPVYPIVIAHQVTELVDSAEVVTVPQPETLVSSIDGNADTLDKSRSAAAQV